MTLRARLTVAFLAVVLGPVLLGAVFVGIAVAAVSDQRASERLDAASDNLRAALAVTCQRLRLAAEAAALLGDRPDAAQTAVGRGLARAVGVTRADGSVLTSAGDLPARPWADCAAPTSSAFAASSRRPSSGSPTGISAPGCRCAARTRSAGSGRRSIA